MAPRKYRVYDIRDYRVGDEDCRVRYLVQWVGFQDAKHWTWESRAKMEACAPGIVKRFDLFLSWLQQQPEDQRHVNKYEAYKAELRTNKNKKNYANGAGTCAIDAVRIAAGLLGEHEFAEESRMDTIRRVRGLPDGMKWGDVQRFVHLLNRFQRTAGLPLIDPGTKKDNKLDSSRRGYFPLSLQPGVYLCAGYNHEGKGHMFVLHVTEQGTLRIHDPAQEHTKTLRYCKKRADWIRRWHFIQPVKTMTQ